MWSIFNCKKKKKRNRCWNISNYYFHWIIRLFVCVKLNIICERTYFVCLNGLLVCVCINRGFPQNNFEFFSRVKNTHISYQTKRIDQKRKGKKIETKRPPKPTNQQQQLQDQNQPVFILAARKSQRFMYVCMCVCIYMDFVVVVVVVSMQVCCFEKKNICCFCCCCWLACQISLEWSGSLLFGRHIVLKIKCPSIRPSVSPIMWNKYPLSTLKKTITNNTQWKRHLK